MKDKQIYLNGTTGYKESRQTTDGECLRVVNLRKHNRSLTPLGNFTTVASLSEPGRKLIFSHECNQHQHLISTDGRAIYHDLDVMGSSIKNINKHLITLDDELTQINALGYTLIITTQSSVQYLLYNNSEYKVLGEKPPMPSIRFSAKITGRYILALPTVNFKEHLTILTDEQKQIVSQAIMGNYFALRDIVHKDSTFLQPILVRYALRLYDGSHIIVSPPILIGQQFHSMFSDSYKLSFAYNSYEEYTFLNDFMATFTGFSIEYTIDKMALDEWRDIVTGIDIFVSKEIECVIDDVVKFSSYNKVNEIHFTYQFNYPLANPDEVRNTIQNESLFYKIASIDILSATTGTPILVEHNIQPNNLIYQERLVVDTSNFYKIGAKQSYIYNNRLHLADITREHYAGYPPLLFSNSYNADNSNAPAYTRTTIKTNNQGSIEVVNVGTIPQFNYTLSPIISYPNAYASSIEFVIRHNGYEYRKTFNLTSNDNEDRASFVNSELKDIDVTTWDKCEITDEILGNFPTQPVTHSVTHRDMMIVSEINNPFYFPSELCYNISGGIITGIAAATSALSQGQYGEFPLYVFTTQGIWSMQHGNSEVCYARCIPINNRSIDCGATITPIDNAIIFHTGENLSIISGANSKVLLPLTEFQSSNFNTQLNSILPSASTACTDAVSFADYFNGKVTVGYLQNNQEMIFCNSNYPFSIVLHIPDGHIYRLDKNFKAIINSGNTLYAQSNNDIIYDIGKEISSTSDFCIITHPLQLAQETYTHIRQVALRMRADWAICNIQILAAYEPDGYYCTIYSTIGEGYIEGDIIMRIEAPAFKYYRIIIQGSASHDLQINRIDIAYDIVKNNKLR